MVTSGSPQRDGLGRSHDGGSCQWHGREVQHVVDARVDGERGERGGREPNDQVRRWMHPQPREPPQDDQHQDREPRDPQLDPLLKELVVRPACIRILPRGPARLGRTDPDRRRRGAPR